MGAGFNEPVSMAIAMGDIIVSARWESRVYSAFPVRERETIEIGGDEALLMVEPPTGGPRIAKP